MSEQKFSLKFDRKVNECAAKETSRYAINGALVVSGKTSGWAVATDGLRLSAIKAEKHEGKPGHAIVPSDLLGKCSTGVHVSVNGDIRAHDFGPKGPKGTQRVGEPVEGTFPPFLEVLPPLDGQQKYAVLGINPALLSVLSQLMIEGDVGVSLLIPLGGDAPDEASGLYPCAKRSVLAVGHGGFAAIMPCTTADPEVLAERYTDAKAELEKARNEAFGRPAAQTE